MVDDKKTKTCCPEMGRHIRVWRRLNGSSQDQLAHALKVDRKTVIRWEAGFVLNPVGATLRQIAAALSVDWSLFNETYTQCVSPSSTATLPVASEPEPVLEPHAMRQVAASVTASRTR